MAPPRRLLARIGLLAASTLASAACTPSSRHDLREQVDGLRSPGVRLGAEWLEPVPVQEDARLGEITDITRREATRELAIVGTRGALFRPSGPGQPRFLAFEEEAGLPHLLELPEGRPRYLDRGGDGWETFAFVDEQGRRLWQPDRNAGISDIAAGDLDGDGQPEFVAGFTGTGSGVGLFDAQGRLLWRQPDDWVWHVEIVDTDADGKPEIVHSVSPDLLTVRDAAGKVHSRVRPEGGVHQFSVVRWPSRELGLLYSYNVTRICDFQGRVRTRLETPSSGWESEACGMAARLDGREYLVLTTAYDDHDRSQLRVFDESGRLLYREVVAADHVALAADEEDGFLFGYASCMFRYRVRPRSSAR